MTETTPTPKSAHAAVQLLCELIRRPSITPRDEGCQQLLADRLTRAGFICESMPFGDVSNLWARLGTGGPIFCFAGHTDVVPVGDQSAWDSDPFAPRIENGDIYGRGAADMKGGIAAMVVATERFLQSREQFAGSIAFLITSDEEGPAIDGTKKVIEVLQARNEKIDWCLIGEPSSDQLPGDVVRIGRRGSLSASLVVKGVQGHVAYPQLADNPIEKLIKVLSALQRKRWDNGNRHFPPTSFQPVSLDSGSGAKNVIPSEASTVFDFRYSTEWDVKKLQNAVQALIEEHTEDFQLNWELSGEPFVTEHGDLVRAIVSAIYDVSGKAPKLSTGGGTSDGRFIAPSGAQVVELGLVNATAHKANEHVSVEHIATLCRMYQKILAYLLLKQPA